VTDNVNRLARPIIKNAVTEQTTHRRIDEKWFRT